MIEQILQKLLLIKYFEGWQILALRPFFQSTKHLHYCYFIKFVSFFSSSWSYIKPHLYTTWRAFFFSV